jgi:hypothetical protein
MRRDDVIARLRYQQQCPIGRSQSSVPDQPFMRSVQAKSYFTLLIDADHHLSHAGLK